MHCRSDDEVFPIADSVMGNFTYRLGETVVPSTDSVKTKALFLTFHIYCTTTEGYKLRSLNVDYWFGLSKPT